MSTPADPHAQARQRMIEKQIRARGIRDERILDALRQVPRERFCLPEDQAAAFDDRAMAIGCGQTISQPFIVAAMTAALQLRPEHRVLEIGTGSGYQTAVLAKLCTRVYTIERMEALSATAAELLASLGLENIRYRVGDGTLGWPEEGPFDRIMVTAGAPEIPGALVSQLKEDGRMVIPVGASDEQTLTVLDRRGGRLHEIPQFACRFVKLIGEEGWRE